MAHSRSTEAFTRRELGIVMAVLIVVVLLLIPAAQRAKEKSRRISCVNNFKHIGTAYRIWEEGIQYPAGKSQSLGGWSNLLYLTNASAYAWTNYVIIMRDLLGESTEVLICPEDERQAAKDFTRLANTNISYFVGVNANDSHPQSLLGGDRNLGPGTMQDTEYGFSPSNGLGNDVTIKGPVCWSLKMHSRGNPAGAGNILLGDGSVQQATSSNLSENYLKRDMAEKVKDAAMMSNNPLPVRLIFP